MTGEGLKEARDRAGWTQVHLATKLGRRIMGEASPAAPDIEHAIPRLKIQLPANQIVFVTLRLVQIICRVPVPAGIRHRRTQHILEKLIAKVVVYIGDFPGACAALQVLQASDLECNPQPHAVADRLRQQ